MGIVTVSMTYGSGGTIFAKELSKRLSYSYFDRDFIEHIGQVEKNHVHIFGLEDEQSPTFLDRIEELMSNRNFYKLTHAATTYNYGLKNNVVFTDISAHLVLAGLSNVVNILVVRPLSERVKAIAQVKNIPYNDALTLIEKRDDIKKDFFSHYFDKDYLDPLLYDLTINSSHVSLDEALDLVCHYCDQYFTPGHTTETESTLKNRLLEKRAEMLLFRLGMVHDFGKVLFEAKEEGILTVRGVIGGEHQKEKLLEALKTLQEVKSIKDQLKVAVLSRNIF